MVTKQSIQMKFRFKTVLFCQVKSKITVGFKIINKVEAIANNSEKEAIIKRE